MNTIHSEPNDKKSFSKSEKLNAFLSVKLCDQNIVVVLI